MAKIIDHGINQKGGRIEEDKELKEMNHILKETVSQHERDLDEKIASDENWERVNKESNNEIIKDSNLPSRERLRKVLKRDHREKYYLFFYKDPTNQKHSFLIKQPKVLDTQRVINMYRIDEEYKKKSDLSSNEFELSEIQKTKFHTEMIYKYLLDPDTEENIFDSIEEATEMVEQGSSEIDGLLNQFVVFFTNMISGSISEVKKKKTL